MRYLMKQKWLSFGDDYSIKAEDGRDAFFVKGRVISIGDKLSMLDSSGREAAFIAQKLFAWGKTYEIYREGQLFALVKKEPFTFFRCTFSVDVPGPNDYEAQGDFLDHEYTITRASSGPIAHISKRFFSFTDTYGIEIVDGEDDVTLLASAVVIDLCCHGDRQRR